MSSVLFSWYAIWLSLLIVFSIVLHRPDNRKLYFLYFIFGMLFGFYFDLLSVAFGYYSYPDLLTNVFGVPLSVTLAEGFAVAITMKLFEMIKSRFRGFDSLKLKD